MAASDERIVGETWLLDFPLTDSAGSAFEYANTTTLEIVLEDSSGAQLTYDKGSAQLVQNSSTSTTARLEVPAASTATLKPGLITYCVTATYTSADAQVEDPAKSITKGTALTAIECP